MIAEHARSGEDRGNLFLQVSTCSGVHVSYIVYTRMFFTMAIVDTVTKYLSPVLIQNLSPSYSVHQCTTSVDCCLYICHCKCYRFCYGQKPRKRLSTDEKSHIAVPREPEHDLISSDEGTPKQRECHKGSTGGGANYSYSY